MKTELSGDLTGKFTAEFRQRIPALDGIRGLAILMILLYHGFGLEGFYILNGKLLTALRFGWAGVDLFFVLSGFLIGGTLLDVEGSQNYYSVFYIRRFYRILPLYAALCLFSLFVFHLRLGTHAWLFDGRVPWYAYLTFGQNFWMVGLNNISPRELASTWSLAIEEQFYLTLPFIVRNVSRKSLPFLLAAGVLLASLIRVAMWFGLDPSRTEIAAYVLAPCRMDSLFLGVFAAWAVRNSRCWAWLLAHKNAVGAACGLLGLGVLEMMRLHWDTKSFGIISFGYTWIALFFVSILIVVVTQEGFVSRLFTLRPLMNLGLIAYGLYLFNYPILGLIYGLGGKTWPTLTDAYSVGLTLIAGILVIVLAKLSWTYFEKPLVDQGHRYKYLSRPAKSSATAALERA
jgi:peptidoglycan/LPS O-acetylase OafA/YrhL